MPLPPESQPERSSAVPSAGRWILRDCSGDTSKTTLEGRSLLSGPVPPELESVGSCLPLQEWTGAASRLIYDQSPSTP